jgi:cadmium resistance protein CadD (predicted permease)
MSYYYSKGTLNVIFVTYMHQTIFLARGSRFWIYNFPWVQNTQANCDPYIVNSNLHKYVKLNEMVMVLVIANVNDDICLFTSTFMKSKLRNRLIIHLLLIVYMCIQ